jgi:hypothetical protein
MHGAGRKRQPIGIARADAGAARAGAFVGDTHAGVAG